MNVLDTLFGPVSKKYCGLFYYLSVVSFLMYVFAIMFAVVWGIKQGKGIMFYVMSIAFSFVYLLAYFQSRLLFSMCVR